jgi:hypothetical protein
MTWKSHAHPPHLRLPPAAAADAAAQRLGSECALHLNGISKRQKGKRNEGEMIDSDACDKQKGAPTV